MQVIREVFRELDYEELEEALAARATRFQELQAQGWVCKALNLYAGSGHRVLVLEASEPTLVLDATEPADRAERRQHRQQRQHKHKPQADDAAATKAPPRKQIKLPKFESR
jgi:hypothetical protein